MNSIDSCNFLVIDYHRYCTGSFDNEVFKQITSNDVILEYHTDDTITYAEGRKAVSKLLLEKHAYKVHVNSRKGKLYSSYEDGNTVTLKLEIKPKVKKDDTTTPYKLNEESIFKFVREQGVGREEKYRIKKIVTTVCLIPGSPRKQSLFS